MDNLAEKGSLLKKTRQSKGITLEMVHETTKIPIDALKALEEGYTIRTLTAFYQRGFLKMYAQYLNLDPKILLGDTKTSTIRIPSPLEDLTEEIPPVPQPPPTKTSFREKAQQMKAASKPVPEKITRPAPQPPPPPPPRPSDEEDRRRFRPAQPTVDLKKTFEEIVTPERISLVLKGFVFLALFLLLIKIGGCIGHKISSHPKKAVHPVVKVALANKEKSHKEKATVKPIPPREEPEPARKETPAVPEPAAQPVSAQDSKPAAAAAALTSVPAAPVEPMSDVDMKKVEAHEEEQKEQSAQASSTATTDKVTLTARAKRNSWLHVTSDGAIVFEGVLKKGVSESWNAEKKIELSGKNIGQLEFEVNGQPIGALGRDEARAKSIVITKNGLSVKK